MGRWFNKFFGGGMEGRNILNLKLPFHSCVYEKLALKDIIKIVEKDVIVLFMTSQKHF